MVSVNCMLISILSVSVEARDMSCAIVTEALSPQACDLKDDNLLTPSSSLGPVQTLTASASGSVSFVSQTRLCTPLQTACDSWQTVPRDTPSLLCP